jgi:hypothetical protein
MYLDGDFYSLYLRELLNHKTLSMNNAITLRYRFKSVIADLRNDDRIDYSSVDDLCA